MGKIYGRTNYWLWCSGILRRVVLLPGAIIKDGIPKATFEFKEYWGPEGVFCVNAYALAKTKKIALEMDISTREYLWERV